ncbi:MAG TPA: NADP-dependent oxidoreductase [Polyangiaceae bacterium]|nr:NADP-dependent oxidoreductase [Polyangiaceae bacterium]
MKAVLLTDYGDVDKLVVEDVPEPAPGLREVKVQVEGASINPIDVKLRRGDLRAMRKLEFPAILGRDVAGTVREVGADVKEFRVGDRVMGLVDHAYAEMVVAPVEAFAKVPDEVGAEEASVLPLAGLTGAQLVEEAVGVKPGDVVLVTGALGSVGRVAVFAAKQRGARVLAGVRKSQREEAETLEADGIVALDEPSELDALPLLDAIADTVNGSVLESLLPKVKRGGVVGTVLGKPKSNAGELEVRTMMTHPDAERLTELGEAVADGELELPVAQRFPLGEVRRAQRVAEQHGVGKVVLVP